ncbi:hypothetical protein [Paenibacillus sp. FSL M8-0142]|uniref:hypothetical protein n=1 Tax=Paenibacillus sp. FSL M8-0142 TaxID=2954525 RepID=UPI003159AD7A
MNYEKIVLELFERVKGLEERVQVLESRDDGDEELDDNRDILDELNSSEKITRSISRKYVMDELKKQNPAFTISKGNRAAKADILLEFQGKSLKAKFYHSRSFREFPSGWHTVNKDDLNNNVHVEMYIFTVEYQKEFYTFLFSRSELIDFVKNKTTDQNNMYHFYFHVNNGKVVEVRDSERDATPFLDNWKLPSKLLGI